MTRAWYMPKALPSAMKPRVPGRAQEEDDEAAPDDEEGIMSSVRVLDGLVAREIEGGVDPRRIVVGGFSQGCAVSLVWGLTGRMRAKVAGVMCLSGYLPLAERIAALREEEDGDGGSGGDQEGRKKMKWFYAHGMKDMLVPIRLFVKGNDELLKWVEKEDVDGHVYEGLAHSTCNPELRDMLLWLEGAVPP